MDTKDRPDDCCVSPIATRPLPDAARDRLVAICRALADPTRLEVFCLIASQSQAVCVCDITAQFEVSQPTISHHLKVLRDAGLVSVSRRGVWAYYAATPEGSRIAEEWIGVIGQEPLIALV